MFFLETRDSSFRGLGKQKGCSARAGRGGRGPVAAGQLGGLEAGDHADRELLRPCSLPVHCAPGSVQDLQVVAVGQAPVDARLLGLPGLPFGVVDADPADLGVRRSRGENGHISGRRSEAGARASQGKGSEGSGPRPSLM